MSRETDERWMRRCLELARRAEGRTAPNPMVGAVVVDRRGRKIAEGFHRGAGAPHAEAEALARAGERVRGATLYVSLEPCNHRGRTRPCAPAVAEAGVARVVYAAKDPFSGHGGAAWLKRKGVRVEGGVLADEAAELNRFFATWARQKRPHFLLKAAVSLDGRVATRTGESRWITGEQARRDGHRWRSRLDGILVGVGTVLADDPQLTARDVQGARDPVRIVLDSGLRTPPRAKLLPERSSSSARVIIATTKSAPIAREKRLIRAGAEVWRLRAKQRRVSLADLARRLGREELLSVLVEGGSEVHAAFAADGLADEVVLYVAPRIVGGGRTAYAPAWVAGEGVARLSRAHRFSFVGDPVRLGDDLRLIARPQR